MEDNELTAFKIYKQISKDLQLLFPYKEMDIVVRKNPIPNNLEFYKKGISRIDLNGSLNDMTKTYYSLYKELGEDKFYKLQDEISIFNKHPKEYPDRNVNIMTVISILYLSGFREKELYKRSYKFLTNKSSK